MISVVELTKVFEDGRQRITAVDGVSFQVEAGEVYGLLGPNGAGKTTTLRMMMGLLSPTSGYAEIAGFRNDRQPEAVKAQVGLVSASMGVYQWLTPREMLLFFADLYGMPQQQAVEELEQLADLLDFRLFLDQRCGTLSTGQRQRVNLARALIHRPPIMMLDEPTRGLDVLGSKVIFDYVGLLCQQGKAVIVSTHRLDEAQRLCHRFGLLHRGQLKHEGTLQQLQQQTSCVSIAEMFLQFAGEPLAGGAGTP